MKKALVDGDGVLVSHGFITSSDGLTAIDVPDDFDKLPRAWRFVAGDWQAYTQPVAPGTVAPRLIASAFNIAVDNGDVAEMTGVFNLVAAIYLDVGQYMLLFIEPQPDADYFAVVSGDAPCLRVVDRQADYLIIESREAVGGNSVDAGMISVQAYRF